MIKVHIWDRPSEEEKTFGHAAMECGWAYISWWPAAVDQESWYSDYVFAGRPYRRRSFSREVIDEGRLPNSTIRITGLNETAILRWWEGFSLIGPGREHHGPPRPWHTLRMNCSTVVSTALKEGGADRYAETNHFVWTPEKVKQYAMAIRRALSSGGSS